MNKSTQRRRVGKCPVCKQWLGLDDGVISDHGWMSFKAATMWCRGKGRKPSATGYEKMIRGVWELIED